MSNEFELNAEVRTDLGKGASRRLRRLADLVPGVIYGAGKEPVSISISHKDLQRALLNEAFYSHIITLNVGKKKEKAVLKDLQRHPAKPRIMHADFQRVSAKQAITVAVPLHFLNEEKCKGVKLGGGSIIKNLNELNISCLPKDLPEFIEVDILELGVGEALHISDITLPSGVSSVDLAHGHDSDNAVVSVLAPRGASTADDEEAAGDESEEAGEE